MAKEQELLSKDLAIAAKEQQRKEDIAGKVHEIETAQKEIEALQAIIRSKEEELALKSQKAATSERQRKQEVEAKSRLLDDKHLDLT